ncbi:hypothetical protein ACJJTC_000738 [Scirpophaga incertulas]
MSTLRQILCSSMLCYICLVVGIMFTWPSSTILIFSSPNTTLHRTMTEGEISLFGSLSSIGGLISTPIAGICVDKFGRKPSIVMSAIMITISWSIIACSRQVEVILLGIFISGFGCSAFLVNTAFICEICQESIRGTMTSTNMVFYSVGMLISYIMGGILSYAVMIYVNLILSVIGVLGVLMLKESPLYLMMKEMEKEAAQSVRYYRGFALDSKECQNELDIIRRILSVQADDSCPEEEKLNSEKIVKKLTSLQFIKKSRSTRRAIIVTIILMTAAMFQGMPVLQVYAEPLFSKAVPVMSPNICSIIFAAVNVIMGFVAAYLTDALGRRPLMIYASFIAGICCLLLGSQIHTEWGPNWLTAAAIYLFSIAYILGAGTVPFVLLGEAFLPEVKSFIIMMVVEWTWLCNFLILLIFNPLVSAIGLGPVFYLFAVICFLTVVVSYFFQPETKGLSVDAIQPLFMPSKKRKYAEMAKSSRFI